MARKLRIRVDHDVCVGNAMCETIAPKVFRLNENRQSEAVDPAGDTVEKILEAAENCPSARSSSRTRKPGNSCSRRLGVDLVSTREHLSSAEVMPLTRSATTRAATSPMNG